MHFATKDEFCKKSWLVLQQISIDETDLFKSSLKILIFRQIV